MDYESVNRSISLDISDTIIPPVYFDNDSVYPRGTVTAANGWNLISLPVQAMDRQVHSVFPQSSSNAYAYDVGYRQKDTLSVGVGYWLKFNAAQTVSVIGLPILSDTIEVMKGWNLIGSVSEPLPITTIMSNPVGIITSSFFSYNHGYVKTDTIIPGKGYWIKVNQSGSLILNSSVLSLTSNRIKIVATSEFPPPPPEEIVSKAREIPKGFALYQNYPNPFNPATIINYQLPVDGYVTLKVFDPVGREVAKLVNERKSYGKYSIVWNAVGLPSGVYFCRLQAVSVDDVSKSFVQVLKILLAK